MGVRLRINLIDYNEVDGTGFTNASDGERNRFMDRLQVLRVPVVRRYSGGASCHAACGMMRGRRCQPRPPRALLLPPR
ncbi:MAG: hypothetical protein DRI90_02450 [Deltaproteobacteria bacterium]|nr:MAG: hypothetical protein DRI90_02450 [Deltaproteobacteria bacterium]